MNESVKFLKEAEIFYIATIDGDFPRVRPFGAATEFEGNVYFCTNNHKDVFRQIIKNPYVEISAVGKDGHSWIRISGEAVLDSRKEARTAMIKEYPGLKEIYSESYDAFEVFYLKNINSIIY